MTALFQAILALLLFVGAACSRSGSSGASAPTPPDMSVEELLATGKTAYAQNCATCHYGGQGSNLAPDLIASAIVNQDDPSALIKVILYGQQRTSVVNGKKFNGIMPPQAYLTDHDIAALVTYIRKELAPDELSRVLPRDVQAVRK